MSYDHINLIEELMGILDRQFMATHYKEHRPVGETHDPATDEVVMEPMVRSKDIYDALQTWRTKSSDGDCIEIKRKIWRTPITMPLTPVRAPAGISLPVGEATKRAICTEVVESGMPLVPCIKEFRKRLQDEYGWNEGLRETKDRVKPEWDRFTKGALCHECGMTRATCWQEIRNHDPGAGELKDTTLIVTYPKIWDPEELCTHRISQTRERVLVVT